MKPPRGTPGVEKGQVLELSVEKAVYRGLGLARHHGQVVFVPRTVPGDRVRATVAEVDRGFARARLEEVLEPGAGRREAPCAHAAACGGCAYQGVDYATQLEIKAGVVREALRRGGAAWEGPIEVVPSPEQGWRTRAVLHFMERHGRLEVGLREEGSHLVVDLARCLQLPGEVMDAVLALRAALDAPPAVDARRMAGRLHDLEIARSLDGPGLVAAISIDGSAAAVPSFASVAAAVPALTGLGLLVPHGEGQRYVHVAGDPYLEGTVAGERLRWHVRSFFQSNRFLVGPLVDHVLGLVPAGVPVLDLYSGVGLFALPLARRGSPVTAVEAGRTAVADAKANAGAAGLDRVRVVEADVAMVLERLPAVEGEAVVLDPPRAGAGKDVVAAIAARRPGSITYVSCDPTTLARDLAALARSGYALGSLRCFDLFPGTFHVETVAFLAPAAARV